VGLVLASGMGLWAPTAVGGHSELSAPNGGSKFPFLPRRDLFQNREPNHA
jgi:hypothetical protein